MAYSFLISSLLESGLNYLGIYKENIISLKQWKYQKMNKIIKKERNVSK